MMKIISRSEEETIRLGEKIASLLRQGDILCLYGKLGSGKTIFVKGVASGLGLDPKQIISPTFILVRQYQTLRIPLFHFDLYRLNSPEEIFALGYEEYFFDAGITIVEWAQRLKWLLPEEHLRVEFFIKGKNKRQLSFSSFGQRYHQLLAEIKK